MLNNSIPQSQSTETDSRKELKRRGENTERTEYYKTTMKRFSFFEYDENEEEQEDLNSYLNGDNVFE